MQPKFALTIFTSVVALLIAAETTAQLPSSSFSYSCIKDTVIECGPRCTTLKTQIPNIKALSSNYIVNRPGPGGCFRQPADPGSNSGTSFSLLQDDRYSPVIQLPFVFPFYGTNYNNLVVGTNGTVSFDQANAGHSAGWAMYGNLPNSSYDRSLIMFPYQDIDANAGTSADSKVKVDIIGTAPHRKWVLSFYKIPLYQCTDKINNTYQLVLHEGTGIVEILVQSRESCSAWNNGQAIIGMQDYNRTNGIMAPGRAASDGAWGSINMNENWRFIPADGQPLLKQTELYSINGNFIANGDTTDAGNGTYNVSFDNVCIDSSADYIVKSSYYHFLYNLDPASWTAADGDSIVYSTDTIHVIKNTVTPWVSVVNADCSQGNPNTGSITVLFPTGPGYTYAINGSPYFTSPVMQNLPAGIYDITIVSPNGCFYTVRDTVEQVNGTAITLDYTRHTYCNTEASPTAPTTSVGGGAINFTASSPGLVIDNNTGEINIAASDTGFYTVSCELYDPLPCWPHSISTIVRIVDNSRFIWTGAAGSAWENADNWSCNNIPAGSSNVFIYEGNVVISSNVTVNSLTVAPGASVTVSPGVNLTVLHP